MTAIERDAALILSETIKFLARKHGTTDQAVVAALTARDPKLCDQFAELATLGVEAVSKV